MKRFLYSLTILFLLWGNQGFADEVKPNFLPQDALDLSAILPAPPANNSVTTKAEIAEIHHAQEQATAEEKAQAKADTEEDVYVFATVLGPNFSPDKLPVAASFFALVQKAQVEFTGPAKKLFSRPRPPVLDPSIIPCEKLPVSASYPSGHSTTGWLMAVVLAQIVPEKREQIFQRATAYAHNRVICGVHYPSDVEAGRISGTVIGALLIDNPTFKTALGPAKAEVRKVLGLPPQ